MKALLEMAKFGSSKASIRILSRLLSKAVGNDVALLNRSDKTWAETARTKNS